MHLPILEGTDRSISKIFSHHVPHIHIHVFNVAKARIVPSKLESASSLTHFAIANEDVLKDSQDCVHALDQPLVLLGRLSRMKDLDMIMKQSQLEMMTYFTLEKFIAELLSGSHIVQ